MAKETAVAKKSVEEVALVTGDLNELTPEQRVSYYMNTCQSLGLNPLTKPFQYIELWDSRKKKNTLRLYAAKDCTDQLRATRKVTVNKLEREYVKDLGIYTVTAYMSTPDGRQDSSIGAVDVSNAKGNDLANAIMKAETKAKRRGTLALCGLGMLDESELETVRNFRYVTVDDTGNKALPEGEQDKELIEAQKLVYKLWESWGINTFEQTASFKKFCRTHNREEVSMDDCTDAQFIRDYGKYKQAKLKTEKAAKQRKEREKEQQEPTDEDVKQDREWLIDNLSTGKSLKAVERYDKAVQEQDWEERQKVMHEYRDQFVKEFTGGVPPLD